MNNGQTSYPGAKNYVFTRSKKTAAALSKTLATKKKAGKNVEIITEDATKFVRQLKNKKGKGLCLFGGGQLAKSLFEADLIDEIVLCVHPVILGSGIPLFYQMKKQIDLELLDCRTLKGGYLAISDRVKH
jgi:dihydrofolate reductase